MRDYLELNSPNLTLIRPEESVDSHALAEKMEKVISFGSTIGIEVAFWGKPVILLSECYYSLLDCCYKPRQLSEIFELIEAKLDPKPQEEAIKFGYWNMTRGHNFKHYPYILKDLRGLINKKLQPKLSLGEQVCYKLIKSMEC